MTQIGDNLTELVRAYAAAEPSRARGGIVALTGFEYQIWSYLADYAQALSSNDLLVGGEQFAFAFETLSDFTRKSETGTICVQVKYHLDKRSMGAAAAEFAAIERFLESHVPRDFRNRITYEIVARTGTASLDWATIQLPQEVLAREPELSGYFDRLRDDMRLLAPRFELDPHWKLIATVYKHLEDPFGFARRAFELCMRRTREPASAAFVREAIAEDYAANLRRHSLVSRPLAASDFDRSYDGNGISLARTPTLEDLRCSRFMERSQQVSDVLATLNEIQSGNWGSKDSAIPVLWIDGKSGCGKSVLLLQIMESLVIQDQASVIWFANGTEEIGDVIEQVANSDAYLSPDFLVVDDIYDPQARDDLDLSRLTRLIVHSGVRKWPTLITCGPTEFRQDFERDCRDEGFHITPWHLSPLKAAETAALRAWFQSRTGRFSELGAASTEPHALMISVVFELEHGNLRPFASRFRSRLVQDQLDNVLSVPLALNRLYIWTPKQWLSIEEEARLERLNQDGDFSVLSAEARGKDLFKLTHPHLSDAIYRALHPEVIPVTFARHLVTAFSRALSSYLPTAVRLLRAVASNSSRLEIVDEDELAKGMTAAWDAWNKASLSRNIAAEMWTDWARWAARQSLVGKYLSVSPLETAIDMLDSEHPRWPLVWSQLWTCAPGEPALVARALEWLASHFEVDGWNSVWRRVTEQAIKYARMMKVSSETVIRLSLLGSEWLKTSAQLPGWSRVWNQIVNAPDLIPESLHREIIRIGADWVQENPERPSWPFVWEQLAELSQNQSSHLVDDAIYEQGLKWLNEHPDHRGWPSVWLSFIAQPSLPPSITRAELQQMAVKWSSEHETHPSWTYITDKLLAEQSEEAQAQAIESLVTWVEQHPNLTFWPISWFNLFSLRKNALTNDQDRRLFIAAHEWINADDERDYASLVLTQLIVDLSHFLDIVDKSKLINRACDVLSRTVYADDGQWARLWFAVIKHLKTWPSAKSLTLLKTVHTLALRWLGEPRHLRDGSWSQIFRKVYRESTNYKEAHVDLAVRGILQGFIPDAASFATFIYSTSTCKPPSDEMIQWLDQWFAGSAKESGGFSVWIRLDRVTSDALLQHPESQWIKLRKILDRHRPDQAARWETVKEHFRHRRPIVGRIVKTVLKRKWGDRPKRLGYVVDIGVNAFLSVEEAGINPGSETARLAMVGQTFEFDIIHLDEFRMQVDVSCRASVHRRQQEALGALSIGAVVEGKVKKILPYGVIVDLGFIDGLLHLSEMGERPPEHLSALFAVGQPIVTRVLTLDISNRRIKLTIKSN